MKEEIFETHVEWQNGVHFVFATAQRPVAAGEIDDLCTKYFGKHQEVTMYREALFVDLRPAFESPLNEVTPKTFLSVAVPKAKQDCVT